MRLIYVLFDSLNRHVLGAYGGQAVPTPNFDRLAARCTTFHTHYVGSLPCMPARRDLHTGRLNFLHRAWGPLEPFDNSFPEILRSQKGTYSHLVTDHYHYFEDGGVGFHGRYSSWEFFRGQEKDKWKGMVAPPIERMRGTYHPTQFDGRTDPNANMPYYVSREALGETEATYPIALCADAALEFLETNVQADNWLLHLECFDPHEPFFAARRFRDGLPTNYRGPVLDWPRYGRADYSPDEEAELRANYLALVSMCDEYLGRLLDWMDAHSAWDDTALIVSTDHGLLLGEHEYWGKNRPPFYEEVARIPLFLHHPARSASGERRYALTQTMDLMPTILDIFGASAPPEVCGRSLLPVLRDDTPVREAALFGQFGGAVNVTDGRYAYMRYPEGAEADTQLHHYTLMPVHMRSFFEPKELAGAELVGPFGYTKGMPVLKLPLVADAAANMIHRYPLLEAKTALYDLSVDPGQLHPIDDLAEEARLQLLLRKLMAEHEAPEEAYRRLGLRPPDDGTGQ